MGVEEQAESTEHERQIEPGQAVYSADGHHIGTVDEVHATYFVAAKGMFFPRDRYVPHSAVDHIDQGAIHLVHRRQEIEALGWESIPEATPAQTAAPTPSGEAWEQVRDQLETLWRALRTDEREQWPEAEPLYRYGWELAHNRRYRGRLWSEIEPGAREDWEEEHPDRLWSAVAPSIKQAWEFTTGAGAARPGAAVADTGGERARQAQPRQGGAQIEGQTVATGDVEVRKEVVTELRTVEAPVRREELVVTRRPRDGADDAGGDDTIRIPLRKEQVGAQPAPPEQEQSAGTTTRAE